MGLLVPAPAGAGAGAIDLPVWKAGDSWLYLVRSWTELVMPDDTFISNQTYNYTVVGEEPFSYGGSPCQAYNVSLKVNGTNIVRCGALIKFMAVSMNSTFYLAKSNLSLLYSREKSNRTLNAENWSWSLTEKAYVKAWDQYMYPLNTGEKWYSNCSYNERYHSMSMNWRALTQKWNNLTRYSNTSCLAETGESIGAYDCIKVKVQDADDSSNEPYYEWLSGATGGRFVQKRDEQFTSNMASYTTWMLAGGSFNGSSLAPVPVPPMPDVGVIIVPIIACSAAIVIWKKVSGKRR